MTELTEKEKAALLDAVKWIFEQKAFWLHNAYYPLAEWVDRLCELDAEKLFTDDQFLIGVNALALGRRRLIEEGWPKKRINWAISCSIADLAQKRACDIKDLEEEAAQG
jgi:hypothetical protein